MGRYRGVRLSIHLPLVRPAYDPTEGGDREAVLWVGWSGSESYCVLLHSNKPGYHVVDPT
jgi:hypothetical protein